jgi:ABC-type uncharacterized transport system substrate-binding protein
MQCDWRTSPFFPLAVLVVLGLAGGLQAFAGVELATVSGIVADSQGRPIAGVLVTLSGATSGLVTVRSSANGEYRIMGVQPNKGYDISARHAGYRTVAYEGLQFAIGERRKVSFRLRAPDEREAVVIASRDPFPHADLVRGFSEGLGMPVHVVDLDAEPDPAEAVRRVDAEKPSVILAAGLLAGHLVRREVHDVPSILTLITDPRRYDLKSPNICFLANNPDPADLIGRLTTLLPKVRRIGLIYDATFSELLARDLREAAQRQGLEVELSPCYDPRYVGRSLNDMQGQIDALVVPYDPLAVFPGVLDEITHWSLRHRMALLAPQAEWVSRGALLSYGEPLDRIGAQAQRMARQILSQTRQPGDFALQLPEAPILQINQLTAVALGVTFPAGEVP